MSYTPESKMIHPSNARASSAWGAQAEVEPPKARLRRQGSSAQNPGLA